MLNAFKNIVKESDFYFHIRKFMISRPGQIKKWEKEGRPVPPPHLIKQMVLREYADKFKIGILVETGTCYGDMVEAMRPYFQKIYSIELSEYLYKKVKRRFSRAPNVVLLQGDSGREIANILNEINQPILFWLDAHYSGGVTARGEKDCPIYEELDLIFKHKVHGHVIIIDDARTFDSEPSYPTVEVLKKYVLSVNPNLDYRVQDDLIRITPSMR